MLTKDTCSSNNNCRNSNSNSERGPCSVTSSIIGNSRSSISELIVAVLLAEVIVAVAVVEAEAIVVVSVVVAEVIVAVAVVEAEVIVAVAVVEAGIK